METQRYDGGTESRNARSRSEKAKRKFKDFICRKSFPCVGAKAALNTGGLRIEDGGDITSHARDLYVLGALYDFIDGVGRKDGLVSFAVIFPDSPALTERAFETALWDRMQALHEADSAFGFHYDPSVSANPQSSDFALSFGESAFFAVGLHPAASRQSRRLQFPAVVLNLHDQFESLRQAGKFEPMRKTILQRDERLCGSPNPMLRRHGEGSAAPQYSGRQVGENWRCPFRVSGEAGR